MTTMNALSWSYCTSSAGQSALCGASCGNPWGEPPGILDYRRLLETGSATLDTFARVHRGFQTSCNSAPSLPQRSFSPDSSSGKAEISGRQNVASRVGRSTGDLRPQKQKSPQAASSIMRSTTLEEATTPISFTVTRTPASPFLPTLTPEDNAFTGNLALDGESIETSNIFRMALACCVTAQWIKIASALSIWASRLRLKFFESPLTYKVSTRSYRLGRIGVFWDLENCPVPSGCDVPTVIDKVRSVGSAFGEIQCFRAYGKLDYLTRQATHFLDKGVDLCPVPDGKESADKAIIMDAVLFAFDHKPHVEDSEDDRETDGEDDAIVVVTGDRGFAALLMELSKRKIKTIVIGNAHQTLPTVLGQAADFSVGWDELMINDDFGSGFLDEANKCIVWPRLSRLATATAEDLESGEVKMTGEGSTDLVCYELNSSGSELYCTTTPRQPFTCTEEDGIGDTTRSRNQAVLSQCNSTDASSSPKPMVPIGGRIRILRHLRCEVAAIVEKYWSAGKCIDLKEFLGLYEMEMGHALIPGYYGFGSLKVLLQSMPDIVSVRPVSPNSGDMEIFPFFPKGKNSYGRINYTREDLRCILYELLRVSWPYGVKKDSLSSEHLKVTGRPLVLVTYEFLKTGDVFGSMRDILFIDSRSKHLRLVDGAQEPDRYKELSKNHWS